MRDGKNRRARSPLVRLSVYDDQNNDRYQLVLYRPRSLRDYAESGHRLSGWLNIHRNLPLGILDQPGLAVSASILVGPDKRPRLSLRGAVPVPSGSNPRIFVTRPRRRGAEFLSPTGKPVHNEQLAARNLLYRQDPVRAGALLGAPLGLAITKPAAPDHIVMLKIYDTDERVAISHAERRVREGLPDAAQDYRALCENGGSWMSGTSDRGMGIWDAIQTLHRMGADLTTLSSSDAANIKLPPQPPVRQGRPQDTTSRAPKPPLIKFSAQDPSNDDLYQVVLFRPQNLHQFEQAGKRLSGWLNITRNIPAGKLRLPGIAVSGTLMVGRMNEPRLALRGHIPIPLDENPRLYKTRPKQSAGDDGPTFYDMRGHPVTAAKLAGRDLVYRQDPSTPDTFLRAPVGVAVDRKDAPAHMVACKLYAPEDCVALALAERRSAESDDDMEAADEYARICAQRGGWYHGRAMQGKTLRDAVQVLTAMGAAAAPPRMVNVERPPPAPGGAGFSR